METSFLIPNHRPFILELVSLIKDGTMVNGTITAPLEFVTTREAISHTGFHLSRFNSIRSVVQTTHPSEDSKNFAMRNQNRYNREKEGLFAILLERKYPGFVRFDDAGWNNEPMSFNEVQKVIIHFVELGYRGTLYYIIGGLQRDGESLLTNASISLDLVDLRVSTRTYSEHTEDAKAFIKPIIDFCQ